MSVKVIKRSLRRVMGIDPSTKTGIVFLANDMEYRGVITSDCTGIARVEHIAKQVRATVMQCGPEAVFIEGLGYGNRFTIVVLSQLAYAIRNELRALNVPWWDVTPKTLKKWTTGSGKADKRAMAVAVRQRWGFTSKSDDEVDAYALARLGQSTLSGTTLKGVVYGN